MTLYKNLKREIKIKIYDLWNYPPKFRIASFKADKETSLTYRKINNTESLLKHIARIIDHSNADYVSLRIIRKYPKDK